MTEVPIDINLDEIRSRENYDREKLRKLLFRLQMKTLLNKLSEGEEEEEDNIVVESINTLEEMKKVFRFRERSFLYYV